MRSNILLATLFVIATFTVVSTAQSGGQNRPALHFKPVIVLENPGGNTPNGRAEVWRKTDDGWTLASPETTQSSISALAGKTIRFRIAAANNRGPLLSEGVAVYRVPCAGMVSTAGGGAGAGVLTLSGTVGALQYNWQTDADWKGTCRMLVMKFSDGNHYGTRVRFN